MMDELELKKSEKHIKHAWIAGLISAVLTLILSIAGAYSKTVKFKYGFDIWTLLDVALIAALTFGVYKKNRFCALGLLIYFVTAKIIMAAQSGKLSGGIGALLFGYFFFQGTRATFKIHKHLAESGQKRIKKKRTAAYIGFGILGLFIITIGYFFILGALGPETEVVPGKLLNKKYVAFVREQQLIKDDEEIIYWYSDGYSDFKSGLYFFTKEKVVVYSKDWEEPAIIMPFTTIDEINFEHNPSFFDDSIIFLLLNDSTEVFFPVSSENGGDIKFYNTLTKMWEAKMIQHTDIAQ